MTAALHLTLSIGDEDFAIRCTDSAPRTQAALRRILPLPLQLHTPKIAGSHIYWHAPLVEDVEGAVAVLDAPPGAFLYWPVRQFLEITYAPLQAETAAVTVLGQLEGPVSRVADLAERLRNDQGRKIFAGQLTAQPTAGADAPPLAAPAHGSLAADCRALWLACPAEIIHLRQSRALMHPAGPIFTAESEARTLHEMMWRARSDATDLGESSARLIAATALNRSAARLRDFCHLTEVPALLFRLEAVLSQAALPFDEAITLAITTSGRVAAWLDLLIPWNDVNEAFRAALDTSKEFAG